MISLEWREAILELKRRKLRTFLTLLGLIFGVGSIVAMEAVGEGSRREALRLVESLGLDNLIVEARQQEPDALKEARAKSFGLTIADAKAALRVVPDSVGYAAEKKIRTYAVFSDLGASDASAVGVTPNYFEFASLETSQGRLFTSADEAEVAAVAVLGHQAARELFPQGNAVGRAVKINHVWLTVVGVLVDRDLTKDHFEGVQLDQDSNRVFVPLSTALQRFRFESNEDEIDRFLLRLGSTDEFADDAKVLAGFLNQRHGGVLDYSLILPLQLFQQNQQTQRIFRIVMAAIAGISILVGGIGIMNIMLANVLERRREVGLLRALGARKSDVVAKFLREATVISMTGSLLGLLFGILLAYVIAVFASWQVAWAPVTILASTVICGLIGISFGVYPAKRAAELDPIVALRTE